MTTVSLFLVIAFVPFVIYALRRRRKGNVGILPCPPKASWLWGHELEAFDRAAGEFYTECIEKYGSTYRIQGALGHDDILVLTDPSGVAHLSRNIYNYRLWTSSLAFSTPLIASDAAHSAVFRPLIERVLGRGLLWVEGEIQHKNMRRLVNPAFTAESVKLMTPAIYDSAEKLQALLKEQVYTGDGSVTVDVLPYCSAATLDVIGQVAFGHDFEQGHSIEAKKIAKATRDQVNLGMEREGFYAMMVLRLFPFITSLPVKSLQAQGVPKGIIKQLGSSMVERRSKELMSGKNLLSILSNSKDKGFMSMDQLLDHIATFVVVGHETTSTSISYALWELAKNPEKQKRLRDEVTNIPGYPSYDDLQTKLPYLDACCKEGLRLYPVASHMERVAQNRDVIPLHFPVIKEDGTKINNVVVEKGQLIYLPSISINRLKSVWDDGEEFRPERWLKPNKDLSGVKIEGWSNTYTFSDGPRNCIGYRLAVLEFKILILTLIRHFVFHDTGAQIVLKFSSTLQPRVIGRESEGIQLPVTITLA